MANVKIHCKYDELKDPKKLIDHPKNRNKHGQDQIERLADIYKYQGIRHPIIVSRLSGCIVAGHGRKLAAIRAGVSEMPVVFQEFESAEQEYAFIQSDNAIALWADLDLSGINTDLEFLGPDFNIDMLGIHNFTLDAETYTDIQNGKLSDIFLAPPFSILDAKQGYWFERKKEWLSIGIKSEIGRKENMLGFSGRINRSINKSGTSVFDPVLCEISYKWFCPYGGKILDPFAGGSVRGIVAAKLGYNYFGNDLREEQIEANRINAKEINVNPTWTTGDSLEIDKIFINEKFDFIFSCPPYADLEVYSDNAKDISNMDYNDFKKVYFEIIRKSVQLLNDDSFAVFVVGEVRKKDKNGNYLNFVGDTIRAFEEAGASYYNEIILATSIGSSGMRAAKIFQAARKVVKIHQNVLVFCKGSAKKATEKIGEIEFDLSVNTSEDL